MYDIMVRSDPSRERSLEDFCQTNYLDIHRTDLYEICRDGRTLFVDERSEVIFSIQHGTLQWQPFFVNCIFYIMPDL